MPGGGPLRGDGSSRSSLDGKRSGSVRSAIVGPSYKSSFSDQEDEEPCDSWSFISLVDITPQQAGGVFYGFLQYPSSNLSIVAT